MSISNDRINNYQFSKDGFEDLKIEIKLLWELVDYMSQHLPAEQRNAIKEMHAKLIIPQDQYFEIEKKIKDEDEPVFARERAIRIARRLM